MATKPQNGSKGRLAILLRRVVDQRGMRQKAVAERIGITESSLSHILNGRSRPRQVTLTRFMQQLSVTSEEEQRIVAAYDHAEFRGLPESPAAPERPMPADELDRVRRYMEVKSLSVAFEDKVETILRNCGFVFERSYRKHPYICDYLIPGPPRVAVECKYNIDRDWDRTVVTVGLLKSELKVECVIVVIPELNALARDSIDAIRLAGGMVCLPSQLRSSAKGLLERRAV